MKKESSRSPGLRWKAFSIGAVVWLFWTVAIYVDDPSTISAASIVDLCLSCFFVVGLLGYAFQRPFFTRKLWRLAMPISPVWDVSYPLLLPTVPSDVSQVTKCVVGAFFIVIAVLKYIALFRYAYRSPQVWHSGGPAAG